jgi:hypothetical protein
VTGQNRRDPCGAALVTFDLWTVPRRGVASAVLRMALDRPHLRRTPGLTFAKLLGTGAGRTFTPRDADPRRWALLGAWDSDEAALAFEQSTVVRAWRRLATERWRVELRPLSSRGRWSRRAPFGSQHGPEHKSEPGSDHGSDHESDHKSEHGPEHKSEPGSGQGSDHGSEHGSEHGSVVGSEHGSEHKSDHGSDHRSEQRSPAGRVPWTGPVVAVTRARLTPRRALSFWRAVPPVAADLAHSTGLRFAVGIGEAPVGLQGTFSLWDDARALREFAYGRPAHTTAIRQTAEEGWYAEELFARFAVIGARGTVGGREPLSQPPPDPYR